jgi:hypothetical protein
LEHSGKFLKDSHLPWWSFETGAHGDGDGSAIFLPFSTFSIDLPNLCRLKRLKCFTLKKLGRNELKFALQWARSLLRSFSTTRSKAFDKQSR